MKINWEFIGNACLIYFSTHTETQELYNNYGTFKNLH